VAACQKDVNLMASSHCLIPAELSTSLPSSSSVWTNPWRHPLQIFWLSSRFGLHRQMPWQLSIKRSMTFHCTGSSSDFRHVSTVASPAPPFHSFTTSDMMFESFKVDFFLYLSSWTCPKSFGHYLLRLSQM